MAWRSRVCRAQVAMEDEITKAGLQNVPGFHKKVIQMFDIFNIRFGADSEHEMSFNVTLL